MNIHHRFEDDGFGLFDGVEKCLLAGSDERHFLGIDRVILAVMHGDPNVLQRVTRNGTGLEHLAHAFFHGRDELVRNDTAGDLIDELETGSSLQRFHAQVHLAELPCPAGLLLVTIVSLGGFANGFAVRDLRRTAKPFAMAPDSSTWRTPFSTAGMNW